MPTQRKRKSLQGLTGEIRAHRRPRVASIAAAGGTAGNGDSGRDISFGAPLLLKAGADGKSPPTFHLVAYTGGAMVLEDWTYPVVVDLAGIDMSAHSRPVLRDHDPKIPLGHTTGFSIKNNQLLVDAAMSASGPAVQEVIDASKNQFPWQVSIGAQVVKTEFVPEGESARANGRTWDGPINIARETFMREVSILTLGADDDTSARIAAVAAGRADMKFRAWMKARGFNASEMNEETLATFRAAYKAVNPDGDENDDSDDDTTDDGKDGKKAAAAAKKKKEIAAAAKAKKNKQSAVAVEDEDDENENDDPKAIQAAAAKELRASMVAERKRIKQIQAHLDSYQDRVDPEKFSEIEAGALEDAWEPEKVELELLRAARPEAKPPKSSFGINTGKGGQTDGAIIAAAAARSVGVTEKAAYSGLDQRSANIAAGINGLTLHKIIAICAAHQGMRCSAGEIKDESFLEDYLRADRQSHRQQIKAHRASQMILASSGAGFATMSLSGILENILYKSMLEQYGLQTSVISDIAYEKDATDFKPYKVYRLTASGDFQPLGPGGELQAFSLQDESYSNQVSTKGALLQLKREDLINDDMGALMQASQVLGRKGSLNLQKTVFTTFLSGLTTTAPGASVGKAANAFNFFSAGAKNYISGAGAPLSISSVTTARQKFLQQTDANGDPIGISPDRLLVGPELEGVADNLFQGANLTVQGLDLPASAAGTSAAQTGKQTVNLNQHKGKYRPIVTPFMGGASSVPGATATQWALLCNPAGGMATVQVGYYRGQRSPIIRQVETDASMLGLAFQALFDFGTSLLDYRCGVFSAGA